MNIFAVLESDDEDEQPIMPPTPPPKATKKAPTVAPVAPKAIEPKARQNASSQGSANNRNKAGGQQSSAPEPADVEVAKPTSRAEGRVELHHGHEGRGRGGRGGRGRGDRDANGAPPRKREFDRHSGTGRGREISKDGGGGHNWGNEKAEAHNAEKLNEIPPDIIEEEQGKADASAAWEADAKPEEAVVEAPVPEPEPETFTLDEFLAKREQARTNAALFGAVSERTVNTEEYAGLKTKEEEEVTFMALGGAKGSKAKKTDQRSSAVKTNQVVELGFKNASLAAQSSSNDDSGRGRGGRGGRGRGEGGRSDRGEGGRGGGRGGRSDRPPRESGGRGFSKRAGGAAIDINDALSFPSL